ncbi:MAG: M20/M25/M40 family metallo-hydrolase [Candidatus Verstraetearchaeota archaeon]|nr:M20/M25/M40 family metallo-hydrolase [Candidatus Verstraetearchaeota archaeon]
MTSYELRVLEELVAINTDSTRKCGYEECASVIAGKMKEIGLKVDVYDPVDIVGDGKRRPNVVGTLDIGAEETLGLVTHYDVVPPGEGWHRDPFRLTVEGGRAYGRGAADDKSAIAACLGALSKTKESGKYNVKLIASPDEEVGGRWGIGYVLGEVALKLDCGVVVDAMPDMVCIGASGIIQGEIRVRGVQGHAGYPHRADNPIPKLAAIIKDFEAFIRQRESKLSKIDAPPGSPKNKVWGRFSFTMLGSGEKENVIPPKAWARFDMRVLPDEPIAEARSELAEYFRKKQEQLGIDAELKLLHEDTGFLTPPESPFVQRFRRATASVFGKPLPLGASLGGDDGKFLASRGIPVVSYGAIAEDTRFHGTDEFVYLKDLFNLRDVISELIK